MIGFYAAGAMGHGGGGGGYVPTPFLIAQPRAVAVSDWAQVSGDTNCVIVPDASWAATDYVVVAISTLTTTITPPPGMALLASHQDATDSALWLHIYGGVRGAAANFSFALAPGGIFSALAVSVEGIDTSNPHVDTTFSSTNSAGTTRDASAPSYDDLTTDGLFALTFAGMSSNPGGNAYRPSTPLVTGGVWANWPPNIRRVYGGAFPVAEGLTRTTAPRFQPPTTVTNTVASMVVLNRAPGVRPALVPDFAVLDDYLASFSVGYAWAAVHNGIVVDSNADGFARDASAPSNPSVPFTLDTQIAVASVSKLVTELAIRKLVADGALSLDDTISARLTGYTLGSGVAAVTIRQLLQMTSGMPASYNVTSAHPSTMASWLTTTSTNAGQRYEYQNGNFAVLHEIISQVTGSPYETWVQANILDPLSITGATATPDPSGALAYRSSGGIAGVTPLTVPATGLGGWQMTCNDLVKLTHAIRTPVILSPSDLLAMLGDRYRMSPTYGPRGEMHQHDGLLFDGNNRGVRAQVLRGVDGYDIVAVTNTYDVSGTSLLPATMGCLAGV